MTAGSAESCTPEPDRIAPYNSCRFRPSKPPWPSQMCAICGEWLEDHEFVPASQQPEGNDAPEARP